MVKVGTMKKAQALGYVGGIRICYPINFPISEVTKLITAFGKRDAGLKINSKTMVVYYPEGKREEYCNLIQESMNCKN